MDWTKILNELLKNLFYFIPGIGAMKIWEDFTRKYNLHENIVMSQIDESNLIPELKDKLNYILKKSTFEVNKLSVILTAKMTSSFLLSYLFSMPLYFGADVLAMVSEIYFRKKDELEEKLGLFGPKEEDEKLQLLEYFKD